MSDVKVVVLILALLDGPLFVALGLWTRNIQPNRIAGIRYPATFADDRVWRETHRRYGPRFAWLGVAILVTGVGLILAPLPDAAVLTVFLAVSLGGMAGLIGGSWRFSRARLAHYRRLDAAEGDPPAGGR